VPVRNVVIAVFPGVGLIDVTGPADVFSAASMINRGAYVIKLAAQRRQPVRVSAGLTFMPDLTWDEVPADTDTVIVPGALAFNPPRAYTNADLSSWLAANQSGWRRLASVCAGAHLLAEAGLLNGRKATTHWFTARALAGEYPAVDVDADPIVVREGRIWTSAGGASGIDLALSLVAEDHGERLAREVARWLVLYLRRPGGQSQFSTPLPHPEPRSARLRELRRWLLDNLDADLSVPALARRAHMSERHFARMFAAQTAMTPAAFVEASRTEAARRLLEQSDAPVESVATRCGFGSVDTLYRTFRRRLGTSPHEYRRRFRL
jgi:transcriptional regulator GlxA family with amidase domain